MSMEYNITSYMNAVKKALKEFDKQQKGNKMANNPTAPMTTYPKGKKPKKK
jgi:hypothetical protein